MQRRKGIRDITMTDRADVSTWRKLIGIALLSPLLVLQVSVLAQDIDSANAAADPLRLAAEDTASCRELRDPDVRLACFDAAADRLAEALSSMDQVERNAGDLPIAPAPQMLQPLRPPRLLSRGRLERQSNCQTGPLRPSPSPSSAITRKPRFLDDSKQPSFESRATTLDGIVSIPKTVRFGSRPS